MVENNEKTQIVDFARDELGVKLYPGQQAALDSYYSSQRPNWLLLCGRRSGKSLLSDIIAVYESVVPNYSGILRPGEDRYIIVVSVRADNAALHIRNIRGLLSHKRELKRLIKQVNQDRIELSNGVVILSLPASGRAGRGYTASTIVFDELAHFQDTSGNSSADSVYDAFSPTVATFGDLGKLIITTTPASRSGIVFDLFDRSQQGELDDFHVTHKTTQEMNPKVSERVINRAMKRDELSAMTEYFAEFSDPVAAYLDSETIDRAVVRGGRQAEKGEPGVSYAMSIDPATMGDRYGFVIAHRDGESIILDYSHILKPPVNPTAAEDLLRDLVRRFRPVTIRCDTAATVQRLKGEIPQLEYTPFSRPMKLRIYGSLKEALNLGNLVLFQDNDLLDELKALQIRNGVDIAAPRSGRITHDDLSDCLALCVDKLINEPGGVSWVADPFSNWPPADDDHYTSDRGWVTDNKYHKHSAGATSWQDCTHRGPGCDECQRELEQSGYFEKQREAEAAGATPMSEEAYQDWRAQIRQPWQPPPSQEEIQGKALFQHIKDEIKRKEQGNNV